MFFSFVSNDNWYFFFSALNNGFLPTILHETRFISIMTFATAWQDSQAVQLLSEVGLESPLFHCRAHL